MIWWEGSSIRKGPFRGEVGNRQMFHVNIVSEAHGTAMQDGS